MTKMLTARVDAEKRTLAERVFAKAGITTSRAVNLFICAVADKGELPFAVEPRKAAKPKTQPQPRAKAKAKPRAKKA